MALPRVDTDVRYNVRIDGEKNEVAGTRIANAHQTVKLFLDCTRNAIPRATVHVIRETGTVETVFVRAAIQIRTAFETFRDAHHVREFSGGFDRVRFVSRVQIRQPAPGIARVGQADDHQRRAAVRSQPQLDAADCAGSPGARLILIGSAVHNRPPV